MKTFIISSILIAILISCNSNTSNKNKYAIVGDTLFTKTLNLDSTVNQKNDTIIDLSDSISICLPYPNNLFLNLKANNFKTNDTLNPKYYDEIYWYLITNLDSIGPKNIIEKQMAYDEYEMITKWEHYFTNDVHYVHNESVEGGEFGFLYSHCKNKTEFFKTISIILETQKVDSTYYNPDMFWSKDSTRFEPIEQGAGCYYEIKKDSVKNYMLEWYCGC